MKCFRIYTERMNEATIKELLAISFGSFTIIRTKGFWKGKVENGIVIEILTENKALIKAVASHIKRQNQQDAVLVTAHNVKWELI